MDFFSVLFGFIIIVTLINRWFDYRKAKFKAALSGERQKELDAMNEKLASIEEMVADILLELNASGPVAPPPDALRLPQSERTSDDTRVASQERPDV